MMNTNINSAKILCDTIASLRKNSGMTQDALAEKLGISYQAVSKWENGLACPDITFLPVIAAIFNVSIDFLFGTEPKAVPKEKTDRTLDWVNDGKLRAVLFIGNRITGKQECIKEKSTITFEYDGPARDVISDFSITCGDVEGDVVTAGGSINCGDVEGNIVTTSGSINCGNVGMDVATAKGSVTCNDVKGDVSVEKGDIECGNVGGNISAANGSVTVSGGIEGNITAESVVHKS